MGSLYVDVRLPLTPFIGKTILLPKHFFPRCLNYHSFIISQSQIVLVFDFTLLMNAALASFSLFSLHTPLKSVYQHLKINLLINTHDITELYLQKMVKLINYLIYVLPQQNK